MYHEFSNKNYIFGSRNYFITFNFSDILSLKFSAVNTEKSIVIDENFYNTEKTHTVLQMTTITLIIVKDHIIHIAQIAILIQRKLNIKYSKYNIYYMR